MTAHFVLLWGLGWLCASIVACSLWAAWSLIVERRGGRA